MDSLPLFPTTEYSIDAAQLCHYLALTAAAIQFLSIGIGCWDTIDCTAMLPTFRYLSAFEGHDRAAIAVSVIFGTLWTLVTIFAFTRMHRRAREDERYFVLLLGVMVGVGGLGVAGVDQFLLGKCAEGSGFHYFWVYSVGVGVSMWGLVVGGFVCREEGERSRKKKAVWWLLGGAGMMAVTLAEWQLSTSRYRGVVANEALFALWEWGTLVYSFFLPARLLALLGPAVVTVTLHPSKSL